MNEGATVVHSQAPGTRADREHHGARLARLGLIAALVSRVAGRLVGVVLVAVLAHRASAVTVALYGYLLGTASLVSGLTDLGVASVANREVAAGRWDVRAALRAALGPHALSLVAAAGLTVAVTLTAGPAHVPAAALALTVAAVLVGGLNNLYSELLRATGRVMLEGALQLGGVLVLVVGGVLVIVHGGGVVPLLAIVAGKELALLVVEAVLIRPGGSGGISGRALMRKSLGLAVASTVLIVLWRQGLVVMGAAGSVGALATYVVASRYLDAGLALANTAAFGLRPGLAALAGDPTAMRAALRRYLGLAAALGGAVAFAGSCAAAPLVSVPFGARWLHATGAVRVVALSAPSILVLFIALVGLSALGRMRLIAVGAVAGTVTGIALTVGLVHLLRPTPIAPLLGTAAGATVLALTYLYGLRDLLLPTRLPVDHDVEHRPPAPVVECT